MKQIFIQGSSQNVNSNGTNGVVNGIFSPASDNDAFFNGWSSLNFAPSASKWAVVTAAGTLDYLYVLLDGDPETNTITFKTFLNGSATSQVVSIAPGQTSGIDTLHPVTVVPGDIVRVQITAPSPFAPITSRKAYTSVRFTSTNPNEATIGSQNNNALWDNTAGTYYTTIFSGQGWSTVETDRNFVCPTSGTITTLWMYVTGPAGLTGQSKNQLYSIFKNGAQEGSSVIQYGNDGSGHGSATVAIPYSAGDTLSLAMTIQTGGSLTVQDRVGYWGMGYSPTIDGESMIGGTSGGPLSGTINFQQFSYMNGTRDITTTEADFKQVAGGTIKMKKFRVLLDSAPSPGQTREFRVRKNLADTSLVINVSGTSTVGSDDVNEVTFRKGDFATFATKALTASATMTLVRWSAVTIVGPENPAQAFFM